MQQPASAQAPVAPMPATPQVPLPMQPTPLDLASTVAPPDIAFPVQAPPAPGALSSADPAQPAAQNWGQAGADYASLQEEFAHARRNDALAQRVAAAAIAQGAKWTQTPLALFTSAELIDELSRRGITGLDWGQRPAGAGTQPLNRPPTTVAPAVGPPAQATAPKASGPPAGKSKAAVVGPCALPQAKSKPAPAKAPGAITGSDLKPPPQLAPDATDPPRG